jgi:glycosyltransferase involved in cell wall biosynthesis
VKIAYLFETYPSPTETFLAREVEALRKAGVEIEIYAIKAGGGATPIMMLPRALKLLGKQRYWQQVGQSLANELRLSGIEHIHATWANHIADLAMATAHAAHLPWSFAAHARDLWVEGGDLKAKLASARFAAVCTRAGEAHLKTYGSNVLYAPHGLELSKYKWRPWRPPADRRSRYRVVGVGRLVEKKGWPDAIKAIEMLRSLGFNASLRLVGNGPLLHDFRLAGNRLVREWRREGKSVPVALHLYEALPHPQVIKLMRRCHCCILPSRRTAEGDRDGLANVLLEAAALGLPIITTTAGSASDFVDDSTGTLVEPGDPKALSHALMETFNDPEKTKWRCANARARVEADFDVEKNVLPLIKAFEGANSSFDGDGGYL